VEGVEHCRTEQTAALVPAFWPGVGKKYIEAVHRPGRQEATNGVRRLGVEDARVDQSGSSDFGGDLDHALESAFYPEKIDVRMGGGSGYEKPALAAADVHFQAGM